MKVSKNAALGLGWGVFAAGISGLLLYLNTGAKAEVPLFAEPMEKPEIYVCDTAPDWVMEELPRVLTFWRAHGARFGEIHQDVMCPAACENISSQNKTRLIPCHAGAITIDVVPASANERGAEETGWQVNGGQLQWATVMVWEQIDSVPVYDENGVIVSAAFPPNDIHALTLGHGIGHALGFDHTKTTLGKVFYAEKTGELMNSKVMELGWGDEGLPRKGSKKK